MVVTNESLDLRDFEAWSGAKDTQKRIIEEDKEEDFESLLEDMHPNGLTDTQLNDFLRFDCDFIFEHLGMKIED